MTEYAYEGPKRASNSVTWSFETQTFAADAGAPFSDPIAAIYQATVEAALARWSSVSGLSFTEVPDSANAAIRIGFGVFPSPYTVGETIVRSVAGLLPNDTVVRLLDPSVDPLVQDAQGDWMYSGSVITLLQVATHEIGHAVGLDHTTDPTTLMYPVQTALNQSLAPGDIEGINGLYPLYTVAAPDAVQALTAGTTTYHFTITRHDDPNLSDTVAYGIGGATDPALSGTLAAPASLFAGDAYPSGTITFAPGVTSVTLAVQVIGDPDPQQDEGFALSLSSTLAGITATVRGTVNAVGLGDGAAVDGTTLPIYRFFDEDDGTHFFTASADERNAVIESRPDLIYEGPLLTAVADPGSDPAAVPVYRFFDTLHGTHFYTSSAAERDLVASSRSDLTYEGVGFYEHGSPQSGDSAVYRFFDTQSGTQFLTSTAAERATVLATRPNYIDEGVAFYAPA